MPDNDKQAKEKPRWRIVRTRQPEQTGMMDVIFTVPLGEDDEDEKSAQDNSQDTCNNTR